MMSAAFIPPAWMSVNAPEVGKLELLIGELAALPKGPVQLIAAVPHLVAWLRKSGFAAPEGAGCWLATLTRWGLAAKLGRLV